MVLLGFVTLEVRQATRNKQAKIDQDEQSRKLASDNEIAQKKIKEDADSAAARLRQEQAEYFFNQTKQNQELNLQVGKLTQAKETAETELTRLRDAKIDVDRQLVQLTSDLTSRSALNAETKQENITLLKERDTLLEERAVLKAQVDKLVEELEAVKAEVRDLQDRANERHQQINDWTAEGMALSVEVAKLRISLREIFKTLTDEQQAALKTLLANREPKIDLAALLVPTVTEPPIESTQLVGLRQELDLRGWQQKALITELTDRGMKPDEINRVLLTAGQTWIPGSAEPAPVVVATEPAQEPAK